jgi:uncharacterized protein
VIRARNDLPQPIREIENLFIPLSDGCRLAARLWLPEGAERAPVPALLEYIPYRKRDFMRLRDEPMHRYYAGHGYAAVRVDVRGSGDSDGLLEDEYSAQEIRDGVELIAWLAAQPWCDGQVGMTGISWGGFNALQVAAEAPPALGAIITLCASDDRYSDDAHYMGGCLLNENQTWGTVLFGIAALPPDPEVVGERWRAMWQQRLEADQPFPALWLRHPWRDAYWKRGSVCEDFSRIRCPVYAIGGWADAYTNAVPRLLEGLRVPRKGLVGPWAHAFPHNALPGPRIGYLKEALRWWDHWLKGKDTGIAGEPMLRVWMQERVAPEPSVPERPGRWVAEERWPSPRIQSHTLHLTGAPALSEAPAAAATLRVCSPQTTGLGGGDWCGFGTEGEAPLDQRADDGKSLCFDAAALSAPLELLGAPELELTLRSDRPSALLAARLEDVAPDGTSARISFGLLNLTHHRSHEHPQALAPGEPVRVRLAMNHLAHRIPAGHQLRLALSTAYWPMVWPSPETVTLTLETRDARLRLPVRPPDPADTALPPFDAPEEAAPSTRLTPMQPSRLTRTIERDLTAHEVVVRLRSEGGDLENAAIARIEEIGLDLGHSVERRFRIADADPTSAQAEMSERLMLRRDDWRVDVEVHTALTATRDHFRLKARLLAKENERPVFERSWNEEIPRRLV